MNTVQELSDNDRAGSTAIWQFRSLPTEAQRGVIRRLALSGFGEEDISARTGLSIEVVRSVVQQDECLRLTPAAHTDTRPWWFAAQRGPRLPQS